MDVTDKVLSVLDEFVRMSKRPEAFRVEAILEGQNVIGYKITFHFEIEAKPSFEDSILISLVK